MTKKPIGNKTLIVVLIFFLLVGIYFFFLFPLFSLFWFLVFAFLYFYDLRDFYAWKDIQLQRLKDWWRLHHG